MRKSRLKKEKRDRLIEHFVAGTTARCAAELVGVHRNTAILFYHRLRVLIRERVKHETPFSGEVEADESYFGGRRKGVRGRGAAGKIPVFGILKRRGKVYTQIIEKPDFKTLMPIMRKNIVPDSIVCTDSLHSYNILDVSEFYHQRVNHSKQFVDRKNKRNHINGIENFWNQAKRHLRKFNGIPKKHFELFLKECEWRFNNPKPKIQLLQLKQWLNPIL